MLAIDSFVIKNYNKSIHFGILGGFNVTDNFKKKCAIIVITNIMCVICSIPVVTAGASLCALYSVMFRLAKNDLNFNIFSEFIVCFRKKLKGSIIPWVSIAFVYVIMVWDIILCHRLDNKISYLRFPVYILLIILISFASYLFPLMSRSNLGFKKLALNSFFFIMRRPIKTVFIILLHLIQLYAFIVDPVLRIVLIVFNLLVGLSLFSYVTAILIQSEIDALTISNDKSK